MSRRFPSIEYRNEIRRETDLPDGYFLRCIGTPEPDIECIYVIEEDADGEEIGNVFFLQMNADERYNSSNTQPNTGTEAEVRANYEFYYSESGDPFYTCTRIDVAKRKWFELLDEHVRK